MCSFHHFDSRSLSCPQVSGPTSPRTRGRVAIEQRNSRSPRENGIAKVIFSIEKVTSTIYIL